MARVRWLDDDEQRAWRSIVDGYWQFIRSVERPVQDATDLNGADYAMLVRLSESPGRSARMGELAECSGLPSGQVTYRVGRLVKLGLVERRASDVDGRGAEAVLTEHGLAVFSEAAALHVEAVRRAFLDHLSRDELMQLGELMRKVTSSASSASSAGSVSPEPRP